MKKIIGFLFVLGMVITSCSTNKDIVKMTIASAQADCVGVGPQKCYLIKINDQQNWEFYYSGIEGFSYEPGNEYVIEVRKEEIPNPAADQASFKYVFVKEISKIKKESENMPPLSR